MRCVQDVARTQCLAYPINERCATCRISKLRWRHGRGAQSRIRKARGRSLLTVTGLCLSDTVEADGVTRGGATITKSSATGSAVVSGGPADKAGLKEGDTIVAFNGNAVYNNYSLLGYVRAAALGDKVTLTIVRDGKTMDVDVTLDQEESSVNGSSSSDSNGNSQNKQNNQNGNGQNGYGNGNGNGNSDGGTGDGGGFSDPFGLW